MADERALSVSLEEFGLSRYEARAYVALISRGKASAGELAYYAEIPRTKVYPVLKKLESKRLAVVSGGRPVTCAPVAPESAFDDVIQEQIERVSAMNALVSGLKAVDDRSRRARGSEEGSYLRVSAGGALGQLRSMVDGARSSVRAMADQWGLGLLAECGAQLAAAAGRGVDVRVITGPQQAGTEAYRRLPGGASVRIADAAQCYFVFDDSGLMAVDGSSGRAAAFASDGALAACHSRAFAHAWRGAARADGLADMTRAEAQEVCRAVRAVGEGALGRALAAGVAGGRADLLGALRGAGVDLSGRPVDDVIGMVDSALQMSCAGGAAFDARDRSVSVESRAGGGHALPWAAVLDEYLRGAGYGTRVTYHSSPQRGERVCLKLRAQD